MLFKCPLNFVQAFLDRRKYLKFRDVILGKPPSDDLAMYLESIRELHHHNRSEEEVDNQLHFHTDYQPMR